MKLDLYYHLADLPGWEESARRQIDGMQQAGLWGQLNRVHFQCHYHPTSFEHFLNWVQGQSRCFVSWTLWDHSRPPLGELYSIQELREHAQQHREPRAILRYHNKGITKLGTSAEDTAHEWQRYYQYWCVDQWSLCAEALRGGYNTVGANWHENPGALARGHWSGNIWWARSDYLAGLPQLEINPSLCQFGGYSPRHDAELWIGMDSGCEQRLELHHYEHGCVYHVPAPRRYRLGRSRP